MLLTIGAQSTEEQLNLANEATDKNKDKGEENKIDNNDVLSDKAR